MAFSLKTNKIFQLFFFLLLMVTVLDPGNVIFRMKEVFFVFSLFTGINEIKKYSNTAVLFGSFFFSIIFPIIWLILGALLNYDFSAQFGLMYLKAFVFFMLVNACLNPMIDFSRLFAIATLFIAAVTLLLYNSIEGLELADSFFLGFAETFVVSRRAFGGFIFDPVVFYKTSPLLIFGLAYLCQQKRFRWRWLNMISIFMVVLALIVSGTRANMVCAFVIVMVFFYRNNIAKSPTRKISFWLFFAAVFLTFIIPFLNTYVLDKQEQSNEAKLDLINDYFAFWSNNPFSLLFGQGLGGGFLTVDRGMAYMAEPTYFEIVRMFGIIGLIIFLIFLLIPLYLFIAKGKQEAYKKDFYIFLGYILYILIEIPSNPLLLASTGMLVMVMVYSSSIKVYYSKNYTGDIICT